MDNVTNHIDLSKTVQLTWKKTVKTWLFMDSPTSVLFIVLIYLLIVTKIGPWFMKNRAPYRLQNTLLVYNAFQVLFSIYLFFCGSRLLWKNGVMTRCVLNSSAEDTLEILSAGHSYVMAKFTELLDTIFFVLRKKQSQVSFLHVYHHAIMFFGLWFALKYYPNENGVLMCTLNSGVHILMYAYYGLSAFPALKKYLWWKKYLTTIQLVQFLIIFIHLVTASFVSECPPPVKPLMLTLLNIALFTHLFREFYKRNYSKPKTYINNGETNALHINDNSTEILNKNKHENGHVNKNYINDIKNSVNKIHRE